MAAWLRVSFLPSFFLTRFDNEMALEIWVSITCGYAHTGKWACVLVNIVSIVWHEIHPIWIASFCKFLPCATDLVGNCLYGALNTVDNERQFILNNFFHVFFLHVFFCCSVIWKFEVSQWQCEPFGENMRLEDERRVVILIRLSGWHAFFFIDEIEFLKTSISLAKTAVIPVLHIHWNQQTSPSTEICRFDDVEWVNERHVYSRCVASSIIHDAGRAQIKEIVKNGINII